MAVRQRWSPKNFGSVFGGGWEKVNQMYSQVLCWLFYSKIEWAELLNSAAAGQQTVIWMTKI